MFWQALAMPVLALHGTRSDFVPPDLLRRMKVALPHLQTFEVADTGHMPMLMRDGEVEFDRFLSSGGPLIAPEFSDGRLVVSKTPSKTTQVAGPQVAFDPAAFGRQWLELSTKASQVAMKLATTPPGSAALPLQLSQDVAAFFARSYAALLRDPKTLTEAQVDMWRRQTEVWQALLGDSGFRRRSRIAVSATRSGRRTRS